MLDLHTHSTASDGTLEPAALIDLACVRGLTALALTDHDTLAGLPPARARALACGLRFIPGIELSTRHGQMADVHILGYGMRDGGCSELAVTCTRLRSIRSDRARDIVTALQRAGLSIDFPAVLAQAGEASIGRPHVARALVAAGVASSLTEAFDRWLVPGTPGFIAAARLDAVAAIALIRAAGGVAVLAHPVTLTLAPAALEAFVATLAAAGLGGIEAFASRHSPEYAAACAALAARLHLLATGGSDFHGANKPGLELGACAPGHTLDPALPDALTETKRDTWPETTPGKRPTGASGRSPGTPEAAASCA